MRQTVCFGAELIELKSEIYGNMNHLVVELCCERHTKRFFKFFVRETLEFLLYFLFSHLSVLASN